MQGINYDWYWLYKSYIHNVTAEFELNIGLYIYIEVYGSKQLSRVRIQEFLSVLKHNHVDMEYAHYTGIQVTEIKLVYILGRITTHNLQYLFSLAFKL